jgi:hypothetical protein
MRRILASCLLWALGCRGDRQEPPPPAPATPPPWTLGAVSAQAVAALPPPCVLRDDALRAYLARDTRLAAARDVLGTLLVAEGAGSAEAWRPDASALFTMGHGTTAVRAAPWPERGDARPAHDGAVWLEAVDRGGDLVLWRDGASTKLASGLEPVDLRCNHGRCALLAAGAAGVALFGGSGDAASWRRVEVERPTPAARPLAVANVADERFFAVVAFADAVRVRFVDVDEAGAREVVAVHGGVSALDANDDGRALALVTEARAGACEPESGGVTLAGAGRGAVRLRAATPAAAGRLVELEGGVLVLWQAPAHCDGGRDLLYGATVRDDGTPLAPVIAVGDADGWTAAARGSDVDLWIRQDRTVTYLPLRCSLSG